MPLLIETAFKEAKQNNRVLFFPEVIIGYPNLETSLRAINYLSKIPYVIVKTATPVRDNFPSNTNEVIIKAHRTALKNGITPFKTVEYLQNFRPNFLVVYPEALSGGDNVFLAKCRSRVDSLIFAEGPPDKDDILSLFQISHTELPVIARKYGIAVVKIGYTKNEKILRESIEATTAFLYFAGSGSTGGQLNSIELIEHYAKVVKRIRNIPIVVGFGIKNPNQAAMLAKIPDIDGITIGTRLFEALGEGFECFKKEVEGFLEVLDKR